jgi:hypothetical protein
MKSIKGLFVGPVLAGILVMVSTPVALAHGGGGGGGHGGGFGGGGHGGSFGGGGHFGGGHFAGGRFAGGHVADGHFGGFVGHGFARHEGERFGPHHLHRGQFRYGLPFSFGDPYWYDYPYYGYYDYDEGDDSDPQVSSTEAANVEQTNMAVQQELAKLGFYHGQIDGLAGPGMREAISRFQSVEKLAVTGQVDGPTLEALQIR